MKLTTKQNDALAVRRGNDKEGQFVELEVETGTRWSLVFLTPMEAECLGNALIKAAQSKQKKEAGK